MLLDIENSKFIRISDNNIPVEIVKKDMKKLNFFIIDHAIRKFKLYFSYFGNFLPYIVI
jgi:hypothetical protein